MGNLEVVLFAIFVDKGDMEPERYTVSVPSYDEVGILVFLEKACLLFTRFRRSKVLMHCHGRGRYSSPSSREEFVSS